MKRKNFIGMDTEKKQKIITTLWQKIGLVCLGVFAALFLLEAGLRAAGFIYILAQESRNRSILRRQAAGGPLLKKPDVRIMCLGESTTANQYPRYLQEILDQNKAGIRFSVIDKGAPATSTSAIVAALEGNLEKFKPDIVVVMMGINDTFLQVPALRKVLPWEDSFFPAHFKVFKFLLLLREHWNARFHQDGGMTNSEKVVDYFSPSAFSEENHVFEEKGEISAPRVVEGAGELYKEGWVFFQKGSYEHAEGNFLRVLSLDPHHSGALMGLGLIAQSKNDLPAAEDYFDKARLAGPDAPAPYFGLACVKRKQGHLVEAFRLLKKSFSMGLRTPDFYVEVGNIYLDQGKLDLAKKFFLQALSLDQLNARALLMMGFVERSLGNLQAARSLLEKLISFDPFNIDAYVEAAFVSEQLGEQEDAKVYYMKALSLALGVDTPDLILGEIFSKSGPGNFLDRYDSLGREQKALTDRVLGSLALFYYKRAQGKKASLLWRLVLQNDPDDFQACLGLASQALSRDDALAEELLTRCIRKFPRDERAYAQLFWIYVRQGRKEDARSLLKRVQDLGIESRLIYGAAALFQEEGRQGETDFCSLALRWDRMHSYELVAKNFLLLKEKVEESGGKLVCVQYPMRSLRPLKDIFAGREQDVLFVDNESSFKQKVKKEGCQAYFVDIFAGDFGHCTQKGNRLLAQNIAEVILGYLKS